MSDAIFCPNCGERISARARFCPSCGARQDEFRVAPEPPGEEPPPPAPPPEEPPVATPPADSALWAEPPPEPAAEPPPAEAPQEPEPSPDDGAREPPTDRVGRVDPQAAELSALLRERLAMPGIVAAAIAGSVAAVIVLAAGLLIALAAPDTLILGYVGNDAGLLTEAFRQAVGTELTAMADRGVGVRRIHPLLLLAIPLGALALTTRWQMHRTEGAAPLARLGWAALAAVPFAVLMLAFAVLGGESERTGISPSAGGAFALGLLWGVVGALIGAAGKTDVAAVVARVPAPARTVLAGAGATLRPLAAVLVVCTVVGLVGWLVQVGANAGEVRLDRSAATALIEETAFAGEHGVNLTALAAGARFTADFDTALGLPFPVEDVNDVPGPPNGGFRIFSYDDELPAYVLLPAVILLMGLLALAALYAGFAAARAARPASLARGAAWGAITGPAWAIAMALLVVLAGGLFHGDADDASVFSVFLLGGAVLGTAGGALAAGDQPDSLS